MFTKLFRSAGSSGVLKEIKLFLKRLSSKIRCCSSIHQETTINYKTFHFIDFCSKCLVLKMHLSSLKVGTCSEFLDASNSIDTKTSTMQSEDCSCLQDNQAWDKASGPSKNMSENLAPYEGKLINSGCQRI